VLLIGDSISVGYTKPVTQRLEGIARVDRLGTSKCIVDKGFFSETDYVLGEYSYAAVHFNNGLHGDHLSDFDYETGLRTYLARLKQAVGETPIIWANSTPVTVQGNPLMLDAKINPQVISRNQAAQNVMKEFGIAVNDLYTVALEHLELRVPDGYHFLPEGYEVLADAVAGVLKSHW
jgi:hypothetical protein